MCIRINNYGTIITLINSGTITADHPIYISGGTTSTLTNRGTISSGSGIGVDNLAATINTP